MKYFTKEQFDRFYDQAADGLEEARFAEQVAWFREAAVWQAGENAKMPPDAPLRTLDFCGQYITGLEKRGRDLIMRVDPGAGPFAAKQIVFVNAATDRLPECPPSHLEWFAHEAMYRDGSFHIGILLRRLKENYASEAMEFELTADDVYWE